MYRILVAMLAVVSGSARADDICKQLDAPIGRVVVTAEFVDPRPACFIFAGVKGRHVIVRIEDGPGIAFDLDHMPPGDSIGSGIATAERRFDFVAEAGHYQLAFGTAHPQLGQKYAVTFSITSSSGG